MNKNEHKMNENIANAEGHKMGSCCGGGENDQLENEVYKVHENGSKTEGHKMESCCCGGGNDHPENEVQKDGKYYCPMKCEGDKTYDKPGNCPVCNMKLVLAGEAQPKCC